MALVALQFEDDQILVASARVAGKRVEINHLFPVPIVGDDAQLGESLKDELNKHGLTRADAIVVVSRANAEMREMIVPPAPNNELPDMVRFLARSEFASLNENWSLDFVPMSDDESKKRTVLAVGISPELQAQITKVVEPSGLKIKHIVMRPYASIDLIKDQSSADQIRLIIDPNGDTTDMTIVDGTKLLATRTVRIPMSYDANRRSDSLLSEVRRTLASSRKMLGQKKVSNVVMFGPAKENKPLEGNLKSHLELEMQFVDPLTHTKTASGLKQPQMIERYAALLGSLKQQGSSDPHVIDFVNPRRPVIVKKDYSKWYLYGGLALAALLLAMLSCWWVLSSQSKQNSNLQSQLNTLKAKNDGRDGSPKVEQIVGEIEQIDKWKLAEVNWLEELYQYTQCSLTPDDAIVDLFDAEIGSRSDAAARVVVDTRLSAIKKGSQLIGSLGERPFVVKTTRDGYSDADETYPVELKLNAGLVVDDFEKLNQIDTMAREFIQARNAKLLNLNSTDDETPENDSPPDTLESE